MAQENIQVQNSNFCISPILGTFASVDTTNANAQLLIKNSSGDSTVTYSFNPNISQDTEIHYLEYIGPRDQSSIESGMVFITMESDESSEISIKKWDVDKANLQLNLDYTINKVTDSLDIIKCTNMAVGRYYTNLTYTTTIGTGSILLDSVDAVVSGTRLYVGPSSNTSYLNAYEEVIATSVSGTTVFIESLSGDTPLLSYYNSGDPVTYIGDTYLFCEESTESDKGSLLIIDSYTGETLSRDFSALYNGITASNYGIPYSNTLALIKNTQLLYLKISDFTIYRSNRLNVVKPQDDANIIPIAALALTESSVYRLQEKKLVRDDDGVYSTISWASYNYHEDSVARSVDSVALSAEPIKILANQYTVTVVAYVRDQYGIAVSGKTVHFDKQYGDSNGTWGDLNQEADTDVNGRAEITYTSGWFDSQVAEDINEDILVNAYTDGSNILSGSIYVWSEMFLLLNAKFMLDPEDVGVELIEQISGSFESTNDFEQLEQFESELSTLAYSIFEFPGGHKYYQNLPNTACIEQWEVFESKSRFKQQDIYEGGLQVTQSEVEEGAFPVSQNYVSRHLPEGSNEDTVDIAQFRFLIDAVPEPFSEKINVNTTVWLKLSPYGFDLNQSTLIFKVREVSYVGDTGYINYVGTSNLYIEEYDAGGGLIGLEITYTPDDYFHNGAVVYVYLEIYDNGLPPNKIEFDYWFILVSDYVPPYIANESPARDAVEVDVSTTVEFDVLDTEVGVDITTLELFINNRKKDFEYEILTSGYHIVCKVPDGFYYNQTVEVSVRVEDSSDQSNVLYDMWRFYCSQSEAPWVDSESLFPKVCVRGYDTRTTGGLFNVYDVGGGLDSDSIVLLVNGRKQSFTKFPIIKRIS